MTVVLDASVLIALVNGDDAHHEWAVSFLLETVEEELCISALSLAEALVYPTRAGRAADFHESISGLDLDVAEFSAANATALAEVRVKSGLKMPDAAVLHLALDRSAGLATVDTQLAAQARAHGITTYALS